MNVTGRKETGQPRRWARTDRWELVATAFTALLVAAITCYPYRHPGLYGYEPDILYHLNRIEGVRLALLEGHYPAGIYTNFFGGEGYGSPLFYPDLLLLIPAFLRILGLSPVVAFKATAALCAVVLMVVCERAMKIVCGRFEAALAGAGLFCMSQFVLADLLVRAGFSSYLSYVFLPLLVAGLYDFFVLEGRRPWLLGVALGGLLVTHTLNTLLGVLLTVFVFVLMLFTRTGRQALTDPLRVKRLALCAVATLCLTAWYWMPLIEQMTSGTDFVYQHPWADVSEFTQVWQDFFVQRGYFFNVAHVGIGVPILVLTAVRVFVWKPRDARARFGDLSYGVGIFLLLAMTDLLPWKVLAKTFLNQLQFTFRLYPWALIFLCFGIAVTLGRLLPVRRDTGSRAAETDSGEADGGAEISAAAVTPVSLVVTIAILLLCAVFGVIQNNTVDRAGDEAFHHITEETLASESGTVGRGEWLPTAFDTEVEHWRDTIEAEGFILPARIWYKGYRAWVTTPEGDRVRLETHMGEDGFVHVDNPRGLTGSVEISYHRTFCQAVSLALSVLTLVFLAGMAALRRFRR